MLKSRVKKEVGLDKGVGLNEELGLDKGVGLDKRVVKVKE